MATKASKRIYRVELSDETGAVIPVRLVRASHRNIALAHVVRPIASVSLGSCPSSASSTATGLAEVVKALLCVVATVRRARP